MVTRVNGGMPVDESAPTPESLTWETEGGTLQVEVEEVPEEPVFKLISFR